MSWKEVQPLLTGDMLGRDDLGIQVHKEKSGKIGPYKGIYKHGK